jgi:hypothetical protein
VNGDFWGGVKLCGVVAVRLCGIVDFIATYQAESTHKFINVLRDFALSNRRGRADELYSKADTSIVPPRLRIPGWKSPGADYEEKHELVRDR